MTRKRYVVTYDISHDKRRTKVHKTLRGFGSHCQYSVFLCELNARELVELRAALHDFINHREDQVLIIDLGPAENSPETRIESVGKDFVPKQRVYVI